MKRLCLILFIFIAGCASDNNTSSNRFKPLYNYKREPTVIKQVEIDDIDKSNTRTDEIQYKDGLYKRYYPASEWHRDWKQKY